MLTVRTSLQILTVSIVVFGSFSAGAQILLQEDFDDGTADLFHPQDNFWSVADGLGICNADGYEYFSKNVAGDCDWTDYTFECDIKVNADRSVNQMVFVRMVDAGNGYEINVRGAPWNDAHLFQWVDGVELHHLKVVPHYNIAGIWHHYRIDVWQNEIRVEFDGVELFTHVDTSDPYLCGGIALAGYSGSLGFQHAEFDNVMVTTNIVAIENSAWGDVKALYR